MTGGLLERSNWTGRRLGLFLGLVLLAGCVLSLATVQGQPRSGEQAPSGRRPPSPRGTESIAPGGIRFPMASPRSVTFTPEREAAALTFVTKHRPELVAVLEELKARQPAEYQRTICSLFCTSEVLTAMRQDDARKAEHALRTWQLEAKTHFLAAQLAGPSPEAERLRTELRQAVEKTVDAQLEASAYEVTRLEAQLRRAQDRQKKLQARRDDLVRERYDALIEAAAQAASSPPAKPGR